jgi:hypothetical protein
MLWALGMDTFGLHYGHMEMVILRSFGIPPPPFVYIIVPTKKNLAPVLLTNTDFWSMLWCQELDQNRRTQNPSFAWPDFQVMCEDVLTLLSADYVAHAGDKVIQRNVGLQAHLLIN